MRYGTGEPVKSFALNQPITADNSFFIFLNHS
jgi:hypothetical protein